MCGIFGEYFNNPSLDESYSKNFLWSMRHRGPDASGRYEVCHEEYNLSLGHLRLSIIDLGQSSNQPFISQCGRFVLTFNGEIYNYLELKSELIKLGYEFNTESDTEVLLFSWIEWGSKSLLKFSGMFSFALYDREKDKLILVRDGFGIKPLFFVNHNDRLIFSSEINPLISLQQKGLTINRNVVATYLNNSDYDLGGKTFVKEIETLEPGTLVSIELVTGQMQVERWWQPSAGDTIKNADAKDIVSEFRNMFLENVKEHMRSDVPLAFALSGGLDSSAIVCAARYLFPNAKITTFAYVSNDTQFNESSWAKRVADFVNSDHYEVKIDYKQFNRDIISCVERQGEPFGSLSVYAQYKLYQAVKAAGFKVCLDGQGADELLGGYRGYPLNKLISLWVKRKYLGTVKFLYYWRKLPGSTNIDVLKLMVALLLTVLKLTKFSKRVHEKINGIHKLSKAEDFSNALVTRLINEATSGGLQALLRHADRNAMSSSIENRTPFLTTRLANFIFQLPDEYLVSCSGETKCILRMAMKGIVPDAILHRKDKIGFEADNKGLIAELLKTVDINIEKLHEITGWKKSKIAYFFSDLNNLSNEDLKITWRLLNLSMWYHLHDHGSHY